MRARFLALGVASLALSALIAGSSVVFAGQGAATSTPQMAPKAKKVRKARTAPAPKGPQGCIDQLIKMAGADPLVAYEGKPEGVVNGQLLWNDPKSKCYVGGDADMRAKLHNLAKAWRMKEADKVRSLLQEIKSAAPQS